MKRVRMLKYVQLECPFVPTVAPNGPSAHVPGHYVHFLSGANRPHAVSNALYGALVTWRHVCIELCNINPSFSLQGIQT